MLVAIKEHIVMQGMPGFLNLRDNARNLNGAQRLSVGIKSPDDDSVAGIETGRDCQPVSLAPPATGSL